MTERFTPKRISKPHPYDVLPNPDIEGARKSRERIAAMDKRVEDSNRRIQLMLVKQAEVAKKKKK